MFDQRTIRGLDFVNNQYQFRTNFKGQCLVFATSLNRHNEWDGSDTSENLRESRCHTRRTRPRCWHCFYKPVKELNPGSSYWLCRNAQNPRDSSCIEVKDGTRVRATLNKDFAHLLASFLDTNTVEEPTWCVSFLFSLNILNVSTLRYKSTDKWSKIPFFSFLKLSLGRWAMEPRRFRKTCQVT